ncbi:MAG: hypothetical protein AB1609_14790 [Bacillota bacterium]
MWTTGTWPGVIRKVRQKAAETYAKGDMPRAEAEAAASKLLEGVTLHTIRHTHAAMLIAQGVDIMTISRRLAMRTSESPGPLRPPAPGPRPEGRRCR